MSGEGVRLLDALVGWSNNFNTIVMDDVKVNNWKYAELMDHFKRRELEPFLFEVEEAKRIMGDKDYKWANEKQKEIAQARYDKMVDRLAFIKNFLEEGVILIRQHEDLVTLLSKLYDQWRENVSNDGMQETEIMESQAEILQDIFVELFRALLPLKLEGMKPPKANNL